MGIINVRVIGSNGKGTKAKIAGEASGGFGGMVKGGYTNSDGHGILEWSSNSALSTIFVDGSANRGKFKSGETYVFKK